MLLKCTFMGLLKMGPWNLLTQQVHLTQPCEGKLGVALESLQGPEKAMAPHSCLETPMDGGAW